MNSLSFCSIGDCVVDIYTKQGIATLGGTAFYSALASSSLQVTTSIMSAVGSDSFGRTYKNILQKNSINTEHLTVYDSHTSSIEISLDQEGKPDFSAWNLGALKIMNLKKSDEQFIGRHDVARVALFRSFEHIFDTVYQMNLKNTLKVADFSGGSEYSREIKELIRFADGFDVLSKSLTRIKQSDISFYSSLSKKSKKLIILTAGRDGSHAFYNEKQYHMPVTEIVSGNTTGAGDVFLTSFAVTYQQTQDIDVSLSIATEHVRSFLKEGLFRYTISL